MKIGTLVLVLAALGTPGWAAPWEEDELTELRKANRQLREFARESLLGREYDRLETREGEVYKSCTVTGIDGGAVSIRYEKDGYEREAEIALGDGPERWSLLEPRRSGEGMAERPGDDVAEAVVVIEGDAGAGTGFLARDGETTYLYTAAHVLSGNLKLSVKMASGRELTSFGTFEASGGADLVRLEVTEDVDTPLTLGSPDGQASQDMVVFAGGNAGGGGTVGFEEGRIKGVGAESIEIDADVIQGNSGGPILDGATHEVLGLVTHLVAARRDKWAEETRYSEIRRFGCRLDREWEWTRLPIGEFLREGQELKKVTDLNELFMLALDPSEWENPRLRDFENHTVVREIRILQEWIEERSGGATGVSEADRERKVSSFFEGIRNSSRQQRREFEPGGYVWFHREMAKEALELREELDEACDAAIDDLR